MGLMAKTIHKRSYLTYVFLCTIYFVYKILFLHVEVPEFFEILMNIMLGAGMLAWCVASLSMRYTKKALIVSVLLFSYFVYLVVASSYMSLGPLTIALSFIAMKDIKIRDIAKVTFLGTLAVFLVFIFLCTFNVLPSYLEYKTDLFGNEFSMIRLGGTHGNVLFSVFFIILSSYLYGFYEKLKYRHVIIGEIIVIVLYMIVHSRTGLIMCTAEMILYLWLMRVKKIKIHENLIFRRYINFLVPALVIIVAVVCIVVPYYMFNTPVYNILNNFFTNRFLSAHIFFQAYDMQLWPHKIKEFMVFDNLYAYMFVIYGAINYILCMLATFFTLRKLMKERRDEDAMQLLIVVFYAISEKIFFKAIGVFPLMFIGQFIYNKFAGGFLEGNFKRKRGAARGATRSVTRSGGENSKYPA